MYFWNYELFSTSDMGFYRLLKTASGEPSLSFFIWGSLEGCGGMRFHVADFMMWSRQSFQCLREVLFERSVSIRFYVEVKYVCIGEPAFIIGLTSSKDE